MQRIPFTVSFIHFFAIVTTIYYILSAVSNYTFSFVRNEWGAKKTAIFYEFFIMLNQFFTWKLNQQQFASLHNFHHHNQQIHRINASLLNFHSICAVILALKSHYICMILYSLKAVISCHKHHTISLFVKSFFFTI